MEIDELGCGWRDGFERKLEQIGVLFSLPPRDDLDKYESMLAEAYLVALLHTVVQQGNQDPASDARATPQERRQQRDALEADFRVVKSRMDACVALQPDNPAVLMLRASLLQRLGGAAAATRPHLVADLQRAIRLAEEDEGGKRLRCQGLDPKQQRAFLISQCAHRLGGLQQRGKELDAAHQSYLKAAQHAEPAAAHLADTHFSLCILVLMRARPGKHQAAGGAGGACAGGGGGSNSKPAVLLQAMTHFKDGVRAEREALRWLPHLAHTDVSKALAKVCVRGAAMGAPARALEAPVADAAARCRRCRCRNCSKSLPRQRSDGTPRLH